MDRFLAKIMERVLMEWTGTRVAARLATPETIARIVSEFFLSIINCNSGVFVL